MIYFSIFLSLLAISLCIFILFKFETLKKEKLKKEIKDNYVAMPKLKRVKNT